MCSVMSDLISFDGPACDPVYEGATQQELYFIIQVNLLVVARLQVDDYLDTGEKIYKIQRPSQTMLPLGIWRWWGGLSPRDRNHKPSASVLPHSTAPSKF